mmetsp:Transcript_54748/g.159692  ORF Transcript_54748/g.159692 Transcript_54748/m.159692 type:complete len:216 (+) Transcript_54748:1052-1699(+)
MDCPALSAPCSRRPSASASAASSAESWERSLSRPAACEERSSSKRSESAWLSLRTPARSRATRSEKLNRSYSACLNASSSFAMSRSLFCASCCSLGTRSSSASRRCPWFSMSLSNLSCPDSALLFDFSSAVASDCEPSSMEAKRSRSVCTSWVMRCSIMTRTSSKRAACWAARASTFRPCCSMLSRNDARSEASFWTSVPTSCRQRGKVLLVTSP